jgi:hypothetical protein
VPFGQTAWPGGTTIVVLGFGGGGLLLLRLIQPPSSNGMSKASADQRKAGMVFLSGVRSRSLWQELARRCLRLAEVTVSCADRNGLRDLG